MATANLVKKSRSANIKFTPEQYQAIEQRAEKCGVPLSVWVRSILMQVASRNPSKRRNHIYIQEPNGEVA